MCQFTRRDFLTTSAALLTAAAEAENIAGAGQALPEPMKIEQVVPDVYFSEGDISGNGYCNNGWVILEDYVLVIDANYPSGARELIKRIRAVTQKPIRFAFDTHHHGDHVYGNQVWVESGATPVAHVGVVEEMRRYETGYYGDKPGRWEGEAEKREDVKGSKLKPPSVLFPNQLYFDDGKRRVELLHLGTAHTHGDAFAWLPGEGILFSGDACVNGPYNYVGDGNIEKWIKTLDEARKLKARVVCPGHGPSGAAEMIEDQQLYFKTLWDLVNTLLVKVSVEEARSLGEKIREEVKANPRIARYASGAPWDPFPAQIEKVYEEITGKKLSLSTSAQLDALHIHARSHGLV